jgi:hypothetical protein
LPPIFVWLPFFVILESVPGSTFARLAAGSACFRVAEPPNPDCEGIPCLARLLIRQVTAALRCFARRPAAWRRRRRRSGDMSDCAEAHGRSVKREEEKMKSCQERWRERKRKGTMLAALRARPALVIVVEERERTRCFLPGALRELIEDCQTAQPKFKCKICRYPSLQNSIFTFFLNCLANA